ncbi:tyrosine-type recombinase/integrase [Actinomadura rayongensis]|uniref:Tyrosine-type recombinase/integrase n=1 Tax=Actinomadura rayongensis TaxID=1429076 RepID=A0A6I4WDY4_9ACTN|nr:tyrosine-type recombinase/integrase [Actinomadura rayongensis]
MVPSQPGASPLDRTEKRKAISNEAGVHKKQSHDARRTAGALMAARAIDLRAAQKMPGHAQVTTTEYYSVIASQLVQEAGNRLGSSFAAKTGELRPTPMSEQGPCSSEERRP